MRGTKCHCGADSWGRPKDQYPDMCFDCLACLHCSPEVHWCDPAGPPEPCDCIWQEPHDPNCSNDARMQSWEAKQYRKLIAERDAALAKIQRMYALVWPQCPCIDPGDNPECPYHSGKPLTMDVTDIRAILAGPEDRSEP